MSPRFLSLLALLTSPIAFAGPGSGNGGDVVRLDVISIRNLIYSDCEHWITLQKAGVSCASLRAKMDEVGTTDHLKLENEITLADGIPRSGRNDAHAAGGPEIAYSRKSWIASGADSVAKIGIEIHENLGLLDIEKTDDYHISNALMNEIRSTSLLSSGNPDFLNTMLKATRMIREARDCEHRILDEDRWVKFADAFDLLTQRMDDKHTSAQEKAALLERREDAGLGMATIATLFSVDKFAYCKSDGPKQVPSYEKSEE